MPVASWTSGHRPEGTQSSPRASRRARRVAATVIPKKVKVVSVDGLPPELPYVEKGIAPILLAQPTYQWGYVSVEKIVDKLHLKADVPVINKMELVPVTKDSLGAWARQLKTWGFSDVPEEYLKLP